MRLQFEPPSADERRVRLHRTCSKLCRAVGCSSFQAHVDSGRPRQQDVIRFTRTGTSLHTLQVGNVSFTHFSLRSLQNHQPIQNIYLPQLGIAHLFLSCRNILDPKVKPRGNAMSVSSSTMRERFSLRKLISEMPHAIVVAYHHNGVVQGGCGRREWTPESRADSQQ
jgi:hypothetical protein